MNKWIYGLCAGILAALLLCEMTGIGRGGDRGADTALFAPVKAGKETEEMKKEEKEEDDGAKKTEHKKVAYLTFDDGPSDNTVRILETLKEKEAVATFFLIGEEITPEREKIVRQELRQGCAIGVHTYCHDRKIIYGSEELFFEDYEKAQEAIKGVTGEETGLYRFPWGSNNKFVSDYVDFLHERLKYKGIKCFDWNVSGEDSVGRNVSGTVIFNNIKKDLTKYDEPIILLHDSECVKQTPEILGDIIDYIRGEGYVFDTLEKREEYMFPAAWR